MMIYLITEQKVLYRIPSKRFLVYHVKKLPVFIITRIHGFFRERFTQPLKKRGKTLHLINLVLSLQLVEGPTNVTTTGCPLHRRLDHSDAARGSRPGKGERRRQVDILRWKVNAHAALESKTHDTST